MWMSEEVHFIKEVKLNYLRDNYRTGFGIFKEKLDRDAIKRLVAEINQAIFDLATKDIVSLSRMSEDLNCEVRIPLSKKDRLVVDIPVEIISKSEYRILWDKARAIPYIRADEVKFTQPDATDVENRMNIENEGKGHEVEGIIGEEPDEIL